MLERPQPSEYHPYFERYIPLVEDGPLISILQGQLDALHQLSENLTIEEENYRYADDKWSVKEVIGHMADVERVLSYQIFSIARGDSPTFQPFNKDKYMEHSTYNERPLQDILFELAAVRLATICLLKGSPDAIWLRKGTALDHPTTVRALAYVIAGHDKHHQKILKERYLKI
ncbi:hypothetical protein CN918_29965 [Priestia megaterium]|nr:hypothetical protein CN918_29965 [Priestia megaterium]